MPRHMSTHMLNGATWRVLVLVYIVTTCIVIAVPYGLLFRYIYSYGIHDYGSTLRPLVLVCIYLWPTQSWQYHAASGFGIYIVEACIVMAVPYGLWFWYVYTYGLHSHGSSTMRPLVSVCM